MGFRVSLHGSNPEPLMSALGQKQTFPVSLGDVRFAPKADIAERKWNVRFVPKADIYHLFEPTHDNFPLVRKIFGTDPMGSAWQTRPSFT